MIKNRELNQNEKKLKKKWNDVEIEWSDDPL